MGVLRRPIMILDDRRASVPLLRLSDFRRASASRGPGAHALGARLRGFMLARGRRLTFGGVANELLLGASVLMAIVMPILLFGIVGPLGLLGTMVGVPAAFSYFSRETGERKYRREMGASYVAEGVCGSCAYPLEGLVHEDDGCVVCPECGAAWRESRIVAPLWDPARPELPRDLPTWKRFVLYVPRAGIRTMADARGRLVPVVDPCLVAWGARPDAPRLGALRRALRRVGLTWRIVIVGAAMIPLSAAVSLVAILVAGEDGGGLIEVVLGLLLIGVTGVMIIEPLRGDMFRPSKRVAGLALRFARCPTCGDEMTNGRAIEHGMTVCTGCGATWTAPD